MKFAIPCSTRRKKRWSSACRRRERHVRKHCEKLSHSFCKRYPGDVRKHTHLALGRELETTRLGEEFSLNGWDDSPLSPLEIAARLSMDDMNIILKNKEGMHYMAATASCFQIGWRADERIGETIARMHAPVPQWEKEIGYAANKFMTRLAPEMPMERASYFIQVSRPGQQLPEILFQPDGVVHTDLEPQAEHLIIRKERQSFTRLPKSGALLFNVKTSLTYLPDLPLEELRNMVKEINSWPEDMAKYKGREHWGLVVHEHCKKRERDEEQQTKLSFTAFKLDFVVIIYQ
ncbi:hypothetical protein CISG_00463 [Coccidioides immitis RMSCC 3703]|uniref:Uncharacterized protein n=1 Tax=Coccidioides immitis RMSCC 3703 TaxID=454286 RepID=A0A0J8QIH0_COCIT|nr:hypothetical protein CISG_00463 [Coccidioides immitis RMSCC 3703]